MDAKSIFDRLAQKFGDAVYEFTPAEGGVRDAFCKVKPERWRDVALFLRDDPELRMDFLQCVTSVDWIKQNVLQTVYHLYSYEKRHDFVVKIDAPRDNPVVPSVVSVWPTADWQEREQYDLLGVLFQGHPDLRRLLMPDDWDGHPMRKDYKEAAEYRGMPTTRYSVLDLLAGYDKANPQPEGLRPVGKDGKGE